MMVSAGFAGMAPGTTTAEPASVPMRQKVGAAMTLASNRATSVVIMR